MSHNAIVNAGVADRRSPVGRVSHRSMVRSAAFGIDVATFVLAAPFVLGLCAVFLREYWAVGGVAVVAAYTMGAWVTCGQTLGMSLVGIRLADERTGRCPSPLQVLMRSALTLPPLVGGVVVLNAIVAPSSSSLPDAAMVVATAATLVGIISAAWALLDSGRMLHDRLSGLQIVREQTPRSRSAAE